MANSLKDSKSSIYYAELIDNSRQFLEQHIHRLTRIIRPQLFYTWLRKNGVFLQEEQEEVEHKYCTTTMKAGHLIDIINTKGKKGFIAFMEVVEYLYPELFTELTSKSARQPPEEFNPLGISQYAPRRMRQQQATSSFILIQASELASSLMSLLATKKEELFKLNSLIAHLQNTHEQVESENASLYEELQGARDQLEKKSAEAKMLQDHVNLLKNELDFEKTQIIKLRENKDILAARCHQLMVSSLESQRKSLDERPEPGVQLKPASSLREMPNSAPKFQVNYSTCRVKNANSEVQPVFTLSSEKWLEKITLLKTKLSQMKEKELQWFNEKHVMQEQVVKLEQTCFLLQESNEEFLKSYSEMKTERDQFNAESDKITRMCDEEREKNEKLTAECRKYEDQFRIMEERIHALTREIDLQSMMRGTQSLTSNTAKELSKIGVACLGLSLTSSSTPQSSRIKYQHPAFDGFDWSEDACKDNSTKLRSSDDAFSYRAGKKKTSEDEIDQDKQAVERVKRQGSYIKALPVVIYAPSYIQQSLLDYLKPHFSSCSYESILHEIQVNEVRQSSNDDVTVGVSSSNDASCLQPPIVEIDSVCIAFPDNVLLPSLPPSSVALLCSHGIEPIVVCIQVKNDSTRELAETEVALAKLQLSKLEKLVIEPSLTKDFQQFGDFVLINIQRLIIKYGFKVYS